MVLSFNLLTVEVYEYFMLGFILCLASMRGIGNLVGVWVLSYCLSLVF